MSEKIKLRVKFNRTYRTAKEDMSFTKFNSEFFAQVLVRGKFCLCSSWPSFYDLGLTRSPTFKIAAPLLIQVFAYLILNLLFM